jgi:hypothetical protein
MSRAVLAAAVLLAACAAGPSSSMLIERHTRPLGTTGPDAVALPVHERYRYGVVVGSVLTETGERGCNGEVWLEPEGAPVRDVRTIADRRLHNMFRFPQLLPGRFCAVPPYSFVSVVSTWVSTVVSCHRSSSA